MCILMLLFCSFSLLVNPAFAGAAEPSSWAAFRQEKMYAIERERSQIAVLEGGRVKGRIGALGKLHHATIKFWRGHAYLISRDGLLSKIDPKQDKVLAQQRVGKSSIGIEFVGDWIAVANYDPKEIVLVDAALGIKQRIPTQSRNVGIKAWGDLLVFARMDKDALWVLDSREGFKRIAEIPQAGKMPYDALIAGKRYLSAFYKEPVVGILDLESKKYQRVKLPLAETGIIYKLPHFGMWALWGEDAYLPVAGTKQLVRLDLRTLQRKGQIALSGLPVFASLSPDGRWVAVNYSGEQEDFITLIDREKMKVIRHERMGRRMMHLRFSADSRRLYLSSYFTNQVLVVAVEPWKILASAVVASPSGLFGVLP
jgi:protein NirF